MYTISRLSFLLAICLITSMISCQETKPNHAKNDRTISTVELQKLMSDNQAIVVDVRTKGEVVDGMIPGALHIDIHGDDFDEKIKQLDKQSTIVTYCKSGGRAGTACDKLEAAGFQKVKNYGGFRRWLKEKK